MTLALIFHLLIAGSVHIEVLPWSIGPVFSVDSSYPTMAAIQMDSMGNYETAQLGHIAELERLKFNPSVPLLLNSNPGSNTVALPLLFVGLFQMQTAQSIAHSI